MKLHSGYFLWLGLPVFNTLNQVAMKLTAGVVRDQPFGFAWLGDALQSPYIWLSFTCEIVNFAIWLAILKRYRLSEAFPLTAVSYAALMFTSWLYFHEQVVMQQAVGVAVIMLGIAILGFKKEET